MTALENSLGAIKHLGKNKFPVEVSAAANGTGGSNGSSTGASAGAVNSRTDAFRRLTEISEFFRKTEPHSPISYILSRAVKWGDMPLDQLILELIPESSARDTYRSLTGIKAETNNS